MRWILLITIFISNFSHAGLEEVRLNSHDSANFFQRLKKLSKPGTGNLHKIDFESAGGAFKFVCDATLANDAIVDASCTAYLDKSRSNELTEIKQGEYQNSLVARFMSKEDNLKLKTIRTNRNSGLGSLEKRKVLYLAGRPFWWPRFVINCDRNNDVGDIEIGLFEDEYACYAMVVEDCHSRNCGKPGSSL